MNRFIKLITESEEIPELSNFYTEPPSHWLERLVDFLLWNGFELIRTQDYRAYIFGEYTLEIYELVKSNVRWDGNIASEEYLFEFRLPKEANSPIFLDFSMSIKYEDSTELPRDILHYGACIYEKNTTTGNLKFIKLIVEKTIVIVNAIRPTGNSNKLKDALIEYIHKYY